MTIRIDAQLSPALAPWIVQTLDISAVALRDIGLRDGNALPRVMEMLTSGEPLVEISDLRESRGKKP